MTILKRKKVALLSSFVFTILPWTIEQGRIYSEVNIAVFILLAFLIFFKKAKNIYLKILSLILSYLFFVNVYSSFWILRAKELISSDVSYLKNLFILLSPQLLFFENITFYFGGIREFGILYLSFLPLFLVGLYRLLVRKSFQILICLLIIVFLSFTSPFFPESREFFLATPFIAIVTAVGFYDIEKMLRKDTGFKLRFITISLFLLFLAYEMSQYLHFYFVHYPGQLRGDIEKIEGMF